MYNCKYCGKECKNANSLRNHERLCKNNPDRQVSSFVAYNKARGDKLIKRNRSAEEIERWKHTYNKNKKLGLHKSTSHPHTLESKNKISTKLKNNQNSKDGRGGRGKKGWYKEFFCSSTYELAFIIYCLDKGIPVKKCSYVYDYEYEGKKHKYYPDFIVNNTIIEIKGFYTEKVKIKTESVKDRPIIVLYRKDLKAVFDYIKSTYNKTVDKNIHELYQSKN